MIFVKKTVATVAISALLLTGCTVMPPDTDPHCSHQSLGCAYSAHRAPGRGPEYESAHHRPGR